MGVVCVSFLHLVMRIIRVLWFFCVVLVAHAYLCIFVFFGFFVLCFILVCRL